MPDQYNILEIQQDWIHKTEEMGSKKKFWFFFPEENDKVIQYWLFKYPKPNTGEHWAEKIAAEIADRIRVHHAQVELAIFGNSPGSATQSFARGGRSLWHGNQMLKLIIDEYNSAIKFHQSQHTLKNIFETLDVVYESIDASKQAKLNIAEYFVLDALIGNTDRHHENWGILRRRIGDRWSGVISPSFDHASSLGRELLDDRRKRLLTENRVGEYVEKGRGGIYRSETETHAPSPLKLVRYAVTGYPDFFRPALARLQTLDKHLIWGIIERIPANWMTPLAKKFSYQLISYTLQELRRLIK